MENNSSAGVLVTEAIMDQPLIHSLQF